MPSGALPNLIVIGAMKCGTSAMHRYLDAHPQIGMSSPKELNFFNGPEEPPPVCRGPSWRTGQWRRGVSWYSQQFDADFPVRGESSPAYTSPSFPEVPARMASVVPDVRLVYLVRDPVERALSQYAHHRRQGTETRGVAEAILDPASQYLSRSRFLERLEPFLSCFDVDQIRVVVHERLVQDPESELRAVFEHVGVDPGRAPTVHDPRTEVAGGRSSRALRSAVMSRLDDDVEGLRELLGDRLPEWGQA